MIYLDYNASTPLFPEVVDKMKETLLLFGNPASIHAAGQKARAKLEGARDTIKSLADADDADLIFTSGATESINMVIQNPYFKEIILTQTEHRASIASALHMEERGLQATFIPVDKNGIINLEAYEAALQKAKKPTLVTIIYANNETGVIQPIKELIKLAKHYNAYFHIDAVQAFGRFSFSFEKLGADYMSLSAHKLGGPKGIGALIKKKNAPFSPLIIGGGQESSMRGGTVNTLGAVAFGKAAQIAAKRYEDWARLKLLREQCERRILEIAPEAIIHGRSAENRASNTMNIFMPKTPSMLQLMQFDLAGIEVSGGSACSSGSQKPSHILAAMGVPDDVADASIRVSMGWDTSQDEIDKFLEMWKSIYLKQKQAACI